jgi:hypothetical protein
VRQGRHSNAPARAPEQVPAAPDAVNRSRLLALQKIDFRLTATDQSANLRPDEQYLVEFWGRFGR